jgi:hypothetical protein
MAATPHPTVSKARAILKAVKLLQNSPERRGKKIRLRSDPAIFT